MSHSAAYSKRYHLLLLPQPEQRFRSLKASHSHFNKQNHLTKRHSLDSKPIHQMRKQSIIDNMEEMNLINKACHYGSNKTSKGKMDDTAKIKYYWNKKQNKCNKQDQKRNGKKVKRTWSQFGKNLQKKCLIDFNSRIKNDESAKINISDRYQTKHGFSSESYQCTKQNNSKGEIKNAKSLLNSTMLTKRQSQQQKMMGDDKYELIIQKLKDVLGKYEKKVIQLKEQRDYYRFRLRHEIKKKV